MKQRPAPGALMYRTGDGARVAGAVAKACGTECVTGMNSTSQGPILRRSPSRTGMNSALSVIPASSTLLRARARVSSEPYTGAVKSRRM